MTRRGENIRKRADGRWEGRYIERYSSDGKACYRSVYGKTYAETREKLKQYKKLFSYDDIELEIEDEALTMIAEKAIAQKTGARGLRSIIESILMNTMYKVPSDGSIAKVTVTADSVLNKEQPILTNRRNKVVNITE